MNNVSSKATPTRIFLSYARGDDEPFVTRLHADLTKAGFTVWFDRVSLPSRQLTFYQEIKDAILKETDRLIYIGGPKALLSSYVRAEWQFALECDHIVVTPILRLGDYECVPGELSLLHCEDFRDDAKYEASLAKLLFSLHQPNPKLGALFAVPNLPPNYLSRPDLMHRVRNALLVDLQKPQIITGADARVGMQGMGGIGKSVLATALARNRQVRQAYPDGVVWIATGQNLTDDDLLKRQGDLVRHLGGDNTFTSLAQGQGVLRNLLATKAVLLVLDDVWRAADAQAFDVLGPRCRMLVTTRDKGILDTLHGELVPVSLFTEPEALQLLAAAVNIAPASLPAEAREIARECGLLPLAIALCGGMARKHGGDFISVLERLRQADLEKIGDRESINEQHCSIWRAMQASVEMLPDDEQLRFAELSVFATDQTVPEAAAATLWAHTGNLNNLDTTDLLVNLFERSLVELDQKTEADGKVHRRFELHDLLHDFAVRIAGEKRAVQQKLLDAYQKKCPNGWHAGPNDGYYLQNLGLHLNAAGHFDDLLDLYLDLRWLEAKNGAGLIFDLPLDLAKAANVTSPGCQKQHVLNLLERSIRRDIHFIANHATDYPQGLFQCLWNTCWWHGYSQSDGLCEQPENNLRIGEGVPDAIGANLSALMENWLSLRRARVGEFLWIRSLGPPTISLSSPQLAILRGQGDTVYSVAFSPDGCYLASATSWTITVWDVPSGRNLSCLRGHEGGITSVVFSSDGRRLISGSWDKTARLWDVKSGRELTCFLGHEEGIESVAFSPDDRRIVSASNDKTVRVWDVESGRELLCLRGHENCVTSVSFCPDGHLIASGSWDETVRVWDAVSGKELTCLRGHEFMITSITFLHDGRRIITAGGSTIYMWDVESRSVLVCLHGHEGSIRSVASSRDGRRIASASYDKTIRIWDVESASELACLRGHEHEVNGVSFSPDGHLLASGSRDETVRLWDIDRIGRDKSLIQRHQDNITIVGFSPDGCRVASGSRDNTVRLWDTETGRELACLRGHEELITSVVFSNDGRRVASGSKNEVRVWDVESGKELVCLRGHKGIATSVAISPDGLRIACGFTDKTIRVWELESGAELLCLYGHEARVRSVVFSADGCRIASGSWDKTVRIWDAESGLQLECFRGHESSVWSVAFSPDGHRIAGSSGDTWDNTSRLWDAEAGREMGCVWDIESGQTLEVTEGASDVVALAAGAEQFPCRAFRKELETVIEYRQLRRAIAFYPLPIYLVQHPSGRIWAGSHGSDLILIQLEGSIPPEPKQF